MIALSKVSQCLALAVLSASAPDLRAVDAAWIRPQQAGDPLVWGRKDGLIFGLPSTSGMSGPRGLVRVGVISPASGHPEVLNFIAVEPVVTGPGSRFSRMAFSELEPSQMDPGQKGKRLWVNPSGTAAYQGTIETYPAKPAPVERLTVRIEVEPFAANHAHVYLLASMDSNQPDELRLSVYHHTDSAPLEELTVTATMGNYEHLRRLWLKDRQIDSRALYGDYEGDAFAEHENYLLDEMVRTAEGGAIALCTTNEKDPASQSNPQAAAHWRYDLPKFTQYWRVPGYDVESDLRVRVNGRRVYWASHDPLPGGAAFENFELRQRYRPGQTFIFGATKAEPWEMRPKLAHLAPAPRRE